MYHSITFGNKNTWDAWHIVPDSRPVVNTPPVKTSYASIPGMDGSLDFTEVLSGGVKYDSRSGSWTFYVMNDYGERNYDFKAWNELYAALLQHLHGQKMLIWMEDDPEYVYSGRFTLERWESPKDYSKVTITYVIDPYKYKGHVDENGNVVRDTKNSTAASDWKWDDLFDLTIKYGKFEVDGTKARTFINDTENDIELCIKVSTEMTVLYEGLTYELKPAYNRESGIIIHPGTSNVAVFQGSGHVTVDYDKYGEIL